MEVKMFLTDHTGQTLHYGEEKHKMIVAVTALIFDTGIIYHIGYENGDVEVRDNLNGPAVYLGQESFKLPDVRLTTLEVDFTQVALMSDRYEGSVTVGNDTYVIPSRHSGLEQSDYLRELIQRCGVPLTSGSAEDQHTGTMARAVAQFERVRYAIDDYFTVRAVPEENISWE